jgi:3-phosphoshikimate 1-carboxyvinyltransferase
LLVHSQKKPLTGEISVPGDKSISHRSLMLASLADGDSFIRNWLPAGDTLAALGVVRGLGAEIEVLAKRPDGWDLLVHGRGIRGFRQPEGQLDCQNAGTCMRLLAGLAAGQDFPSTLDGSSQLRRRPMSRIIHPLQEMGADITSDDGRAPLRFFPSQLNGISYRMPVASAQVKSAILLASLYADGLTSVTEPGPTRDHTERMLESMDVDISINGDEKSIEGPVERLAPLDIITPGDFSSAAFLLVAAAIVPHADVTLNGVGVNPTRTGLLDILRRMGVDVSVSKMQTAGGEVTAELRASFTELNSTVVRGADVVRAIDEFPIWAAAATQAVGQSELSEASELRVKEVDRISLAAQEFNKMGARIQEKEDGLVIKGPTKLQGAHVESHGDHRMGMALAVAGLSASGSTTIENADCISDSFPDFVKTMRSLGADMRWAA